MGDKVGEGEVSIILGITVGDGSTVIMEAGEQPTRKLRISDTRNIFLTV